MGSIFIVSCPWSAWAPAWAAGGCAWSACPGAASCCAHAHAAKSSTLTTTGNFFIAVLLIFFFSHEASTGVPVEDGCGLTVGNNGNGFEVTAKDYKRNACFPYPHLRGQSQLRGVWSQ